VRQLIGAVTLAVGLAACGASRAPAVRTPPAAKTGGTLTVLWQYDASLIDCGATYYTPDWMICSSTQRTLYSRRPADGNRLVPDLAATAPQVSADRKTVTVAIRDGVRFSPPVNREVTSRDVKYAIERGFFNTVNNGYAGAYFGALDGAHPGTEPGTTIRGLKTPDDRTLVFRLTQPTGAMLAAGALALPLTAPVPAEYAGPLDARNPSGYGQRQVATGPYMIENDVEGRAVGYQAGRHIDLVRNPNWDRRTDYRPAYLDEIHHRTGNEDTTVAGRRILTGSAMVTGDFPPPPEIIRLAQSGRREQLLVLPGSSGRWVSLNTTVPPFDDINVRKAVIAGFDREALRQTRGGPISGRIATHFLPPSIAGFEEAGGDSGPGQDFLNASGKPMPDISAAYFRKAGYAGGRYTGEEPILMIGGNGADARKAALIAEQNFKRMGFKVKLRLLSYETSFSRFCSVPAAKVAVCPNVGWVADFADGQAMLDPTFNGANIRPTNNANFSELDDPGVNTAITRAQLASEPAERARAWGAVDRAVTAQAAAIPWLWDNGLVLKSKDVNLAVNPAIGAVDLNYTSLR
jgi:peptide/nickel transport system substrate-binding protein